jgi:hypothetical protein
MSKVTETDLPALLTPLQRLARSREAIEVALGHDTGGAERKDSDTRSPLASGGAQSKAGSKSSSGWWPVMTSLVRTWWHRHPLNAVAHMAEPILASYAKREPVKLLGAAALVGVVIAVARPWRLMSAGALLAAALRPSEISAFAMTMLASFNGTLQKDKEEREARRKP